MFLLTRRLSAILPLIWVAIGLLQMPWLIPLPSAVMAAFLLWRHRRIMTLVGTAPLASHGFAQHVMVDDLLRLAGQVLVSPLLYALGQFMGTLLAPA